MRLNQTLKHMCWQFLLLKHGRAKQLHAFVRTSRILSGITYPSPRHLITVRLKSSSPVSSHQLTSSHIVSSLPSHRLPLLLSLLPLPLLISCSLPPSRLTPPIVCLLTSARRTFFIHERRKPFTVCFGLLIPGSRCRAAVFGLAAVLFL
jgi:hypothetical protein